MPLAMNPSATSPRLARGGALSLAPEIVTVLVVKVLLLALLWALFVRGHGVRVDAAQTAAFFGMADPKTVTRTTTQGGIHGQ